MATVREGNRPVMLVVDVQVGVVKDSWDAPRIVKNVSRAVERARAEAVPVIWVQHADENLPEGSPQWQWVPELVPADGERLIHKEFNSSFEQTSLENELAALGATHIVLAGPPPIGAFGPRHTVHWSGVMTSPGKRRPHD